MAYHEGERAVQLRAGWTRDNWGSAGVTPEIPAVGAEFLQQQRMLFVGAVDDTDAPWATVLTGPTGFLQPAGERTVIINSLPSTLDPLAGPLAGETEVGMLAIEPLSRRRMRINGRAHHEPGRLVVHTDQVYSNCPKYIQARTLVSEPYDSEAPGPAQTTEALTPGQQRWISTADTFFVATHAPRHGADLSHRGGNPGFVHVVDAQRLVWPDYIGNSMYMTLGNLEFSPACGLLFLDWTHGHALHLTGRAETDWDLDRAATVPGAKRLIDFTVDRVVQIDHATPLRWIFVKYFRHNPPTKQSREGAHP